MNVVSLTDVVSITACRACKGKLEEVIDFGEPCVVNFGDKLRLKAPLVLLHCKDCDLIQLRHTVDPKYLFSEKYYYKSGVNRTMQNHLRDIVLEATKRVSLDHHDSVIDIGANDGTLLRNYPKFVTKIGFEPAKNLTNEATHDDSTYIINDFFSTKALLEFTLPAFAYPAKIITAIAMFYDLDDPNEFLHDVSECLDRDGIFIIQQNYLGSMLAQNAFDNIVHEHLEYYSLTTLKNVLDRHGLVITDVEFNNVNGGSFRTYIRHDTSSESKIEDSVFRTLEKEKKLDLDKIQTYKDFAHRAQQIKIQLKGFLVDKAIRQGKRIYVYGASTRGSMLLQMFDIDNRLVQAAVDRNPEKKGQIIVGPNIPIIMEEQARINPPDYYLVLPWYFLGEFVEREWAYLKNGGKYIIPLPEPTLLEGTPLAK